MSYSFVIIDLKNNLDIGNIYNQLCLHYSQFEVVYCSSKKSNISGIVNYVFSNAESTESVINSVVKHCTKSNIIMIRKYTSIADITALTSKLTSKNQIVYFSKPLSKAKTLTWKVLNFFAKLLYHNNVLAMNLSCIAYGENASNVLKVLEYPSNLMRINKWEGINMIGINGGQNYQPEYNLKKHVLLFAVPLTIAAIAIVCYFVFYQKISQLTRVISWLTAIICVILSIMFGVNWFICSKVGQGNQTKAKIIKG